MNTIDSYLKQNNIIITGILHIGSHECEELTSYTNYGINSNDIIWIDGLQDKVTLCKNKGIKNVYKQLISDKDNELVKFYRTNNNQSSSIFEMGTHLIHHPEVFVTESYLDTTITIDTFFKKNNLNSNKYNFWNFDIQGAELKALMGSTESIKNVDVIYLEISFEYIYKNGALSTEIDSFLEKYNFKRILTHMTKYNWGDAVYIKQK
jgi:FkbM family methyltransferase